jgi:hypothetical protein
MGLPRVRFTMRQMMIGVAVMAVFLGGLIEGPRHYWRCKSRAASCYRIGSHLWIASVRERIEDPALSEKLARSAEWHYYMVQRYD